MKRNLYRMIIFIIALLSYGYTYAYDFEENGIYYNYVNRTAKTVEVTLNVSIISYSGYVTIPEQVSHLGVKYTVIGIGKGAFSQCNDLSGVTVPNTVTYFDESAFAWIKSQFELNFPENLDSIGRSCFYDSRFNKDIIIRPKYRVGESAFHFSQIRSVEFEEGIEKIENNLFLGDTNLRTVIIPNSMKSIGKSAFGGCTYLKEIVCKAVNPPMLGLQVFYNDKSTCKLYVPVGSGGVYKNSEQWKALTIVEDPDITLDITATIELIDAIGTVLLTDACKAKIDAARAAYDALTKEKQEYISNYSTLTDAEAKYAELKKAEEIANANAAKAVDDKIFVIGTVEYTDACKNKIDAARAAYDALTKVQQTLVANLKALTDAEAKYAELKKAAEIAAANAEAAKAVNDKISAIGNVECSDACKARIDAARSAYDALTKEQQALVTNLKTLTDAEAKYAELKKAAEIAAANAEAAKVVNDRISAIGNVEYSDACKAKIDAARSAYDALTKEQQALVTNLKALTDAEAKYAELKKEAEIAAENAVVAKFVTNMINSIGTVEYSDACKSKIDAARSAYDALTKEQQSLVTNLMTLTDAEAKYAELKKAAEIAEANAKAAKAVDDKISAIGTVAYTDACKTKIDAARSAYDALTMDQQALVTNLKVLTDAEAKYAELKKVAEIAAANAEAAKAVNDKITAIGSVEYSDDCKSKIDAARSAYDALTKEQQALVTNLNVLTDAEAKYAELKKTAEIAAAIEKAIKVVTDLIDAIGKIEYTEVCKDRIDAARAAYDALPEDQRALVKNYDMLITAEEEYDKIEASTGIAGINAETKMKDGKYLKNGKLVIVKNGRKYYSNGLLNLK